MQKNRSKITVYFENPFWVCVYERFENKKVSVYKITFGAEPKDYEVYAYLMENWKTLVFSKPRRREDRQDGTRRRNPKRLQREINKQLSSHGVGTKSQNALKLQQEETKLIRKKQSRRKKEEELQRKYELRQEKRKKKHKGR